MATPGSQLAGDTAAGVHLGMGRRDAGQVQQPASLPRYTCFFSTHTCPS